MFDYRGDKVLVDHDSGLGWILLRTEISRLAPPVAGVPQPALHARARRAVAEDASGPPGRAGARPSPIQSHPLKPKT